MPAPAIDLAHGTLRIQDARDWGEIMRREIALRPLRPLLGAAWPPFHRLRSIAMWIAGIKILKEMGFEPRTVFDIGVAAGTPDLYAAFPNAHFVLVDPTRESRPHMERIARHYDAAIFNVALGDRDGQVDIATRPDDINGATLFEEIGPLGAPCRYSVPMYRFDGLFGEIGRPAACKIDVQGAELMVLLGMGERMIDFDVFIVEVSLIATIKGAPDAYEVIAHMRQKGFVIFDIVGLARRPLDNALAQVDMLFVREDSPFRADRRWRDHL
jgi:FkbM family methyltransferase